MARSGILGFPKNTRPRLLHTFLAPLFCMGYFQATKRTKIVAYALTTGIILLLILVRMALQPWCGIIDAGVVISLSWGMISHADC